MNMNERTIQNGVCRVQMTGICKSFGGINALNDVSLELRAGEIHALMGENGAGKSTLMRIMSGVYQADAGEIMIEGEKKQMLSPKDGIDNGISVIWQEFSLMPHLTVAENILIDELNTGKKIVNWSEFYRKARAILDELGYSNIDERSAVGSLSTSQQQVVEICKALSRKSKILVLDEPTSVLTFKETEHLFEILNRLKAQGISIIYISHRLEEIFRICDTITVLKDGGYVTTVNTDEIDKERLVNLMVGREMTAMFPERHATIGEVVLRAEDIHAGKMVDGVRFEVHAGEVLGFSGLVGAGRTETMRAIFGADRMDSGRVTYLGKDVRFRSPREAVKAGLGMVPENRKEQGLLLQQSIRMNTTLACMNKVTDKTHNIIFHAKEKAFVKEALGAIHTKYASTEDNADSLSGGNQQKIALARWMAADCRCIIFDEPTRGVDIGAKMEIYGVINSVAQAGVAVIVISSEMPEIIGLCDRVIVMNKGRVTGELKKEELSENNLIKLAMEV